MSQNSCVLIILVPTQGAAKNHILPIKYYQTIDNPILKNETIPQLIGHAAKKNIIQ